MFISSHFYSCMTINQIIIFFTKIIGRPQFTIIISDKLIFISQFIYESEYKFIGYIIKR